MSHCPWDAVCSYSFIRVVTEEKVTVSREMHVTTKKRMEKNHRCVNNLIYSFKKDTWCTCHRSYRAPGMQGTSPGVSGPHKAASVVGGRGTLITEPDNIKLYEDKRKRVMCKHTMRGPILEDWKRCPWRGDY